MVSRFCRWNVLCRQLPFLMSMLLVLSGCNPTKEASPPLTPTRTQSPVQSSPVGAFSIANLLEVRSSQALICIPPSSSALFSEKSLVLTTDRLIYDQAEVKQISAFVDSQGSDLVGDIWNVPSTPPDTLKYVTGSASASVIYPGGPYPSTPCSVYLTLTNISQETLQIPQFHLRYLHNSEPNTQRYRLINVCSIGKRLQEGNACPIMGAGPGSGYGVGFTVGRGLTNTVYSDKPQSQQAGMGTPLPTIPTLRPGDAAEITMGINVTNYTSGLFVSAVPEIVVTSLNGTQTLPLAQLKMDIAIAASQNVSCYALHGTTFVAQDPQMQAGSWCI